uniref:Uncharacterized protein n=1 Tax=Myotis myotis TaxID=51298 RepID=A0A7J7ZY08_MYOMY|nr:hypothetical protein mMyoMyo1_010012 [Myotis myotis]
MTYSSKSRGALHRVGLQTRTPTMRRGNYTSRNAPLRACAVGLGRLGGLPGAAPGRFRFRPSPSPRKMEAGGRGAAGPLHPQLRRHPWCSRRRAPGSPAVPNSASIFATKRAVSLGTARVPGLGSRSPRAHRDRARLDAGERSGLGWRAWRSGQSWMGTRRAAPASLTLCVQKHEGSARPGEERPGLESVEKRAEQSTAGSLKWECTLRRRRGRPVWLSG